MFVVLLLSCFQSECSCSHNCFTASTCTPVTVRDLEGGYVMMCHQRRLKKNVPFSRTLAHGSERWPKPRWKSLLRGCNSLRHSWGSSAGSLSGSKTSGTSAHLVDLRVQEQARDVQGRSAGWKGWSFKMRQYTSAVDEELYVELVDVEANPLRELLMAGM